MMLLDGIMLSIQLYTNSDIASVCACKAFKLNEIGRMKSFGMYMNSPEASALLQFLHIACNAVVKQFEILLTYKSNTVNAK